jgi:methionyl-tRNA formyltransferase
MARDAETGVCIMQMEAGLDTGPVLLCRATPIGATETTGELHDRLSVIGAEAITEALANLDTLTPEPQPEHGVTYAEKIDKSETRVDWTRPAAEVDAHIRGLSPFPGAWTEGEGQRIKLLASQLANGQGTPGEILDDTLTVACGDGAIRLLRLQRAGKGAQDAEEFLRGMALPTGTELT